MSTALSGGHSQLSYAIKSSRFSEHRHSVWQVSRLQIVLRKNPLQFHPLDSIELTPLQRVERGMHGLEHVQSQVFDLLRSGTEQIWLDLKKPSKPTPGSLPGSQLNILCLN